MKRVEDKEFLKTIKAVYHLILPQALRGKIRFLLFKQLRKFGITKFLKNLVCQNQIKLTVSKAEIILKSKSDYIKIHKLVEEDEIKPPIHLEGQKLNGMQSFVARTETVLLDIAECGFSLRNNYLLDNELNLITESGVGFEKLAIYFHVLPKPKKIKGTVAYLSDPEPLNYYHWLCRVLPLIRIYQEEIGLENIDFFYVGHDPLSSFHKESLAKAGIAMNKIIQQACTADRIVAAINSRTVEFGDPINKSAYLFSRNLFYDASRLTKSKKNRIYVKRGNVSRRKVINELEVITLLEEYGFESVEMDNKTVQEQADIFSQAEAIVAPHGAAMTNLLFINKGVKVIELIPYGYVNNCFYAMANYGEADYFYLQGEKTNQDNIDTRHLNLYIDIKKLDEICKIASLDKSVLV